MRPWVKVWRPRNGSAFEARVPAAARMLFRGMLALFDEDGRMPLPKKPKLHLAFAMAHGYERTERQVLKKQLDALLAHGCLAAEQSEDGFWTLIAPEFAAFQGTEKPATRSQEPNKVKPTSRRHDDDNETTSSRERADLASTTSRERDDYTQRTSKVLTPKPPKSLERKSQDKEGDKEGEGEGDMRARSSFGDPLQELPDRIPLLRYVHRLWCKFMRQRSKQPRWGEDRITGKEAERLREVANWAALVASSAKTLEEWQEQAAAALVGSLKVYAAELDRSPTMTLHPAFWFQKRESWVSGVAA